MPSANNTWIRLRCGYCGNIERQIPVSDLFSADADKHHIQCPECKAYLLNRRVPFKPFTGDSDTEALKRAQEAYSEHRFDEACETYGALIAQDSHRDDPEAYWQYLMCYYGIVWIQDGAANDLKPIIFHPRSGSERLIINHPRYRRLMNLPMEEGDWNYYQQNAERIDNILSAVVDCPDDYDVFLCCKKYVPGTSDLAPERYAAYSLKEHLEDRGYSVFIDDAITDGLNYEACILAAMRNARLMFVFASSTDYLHSPWVQNEWERFLWLRQLSESATVPESGRRYIVPVSCGNMRIRDFDSSLRKDQGVEYSPNTDWSGWDALKNCLNRVPPGRTPSPARENPRAQSSAVQPAGPRSFYTVRDLLGRGEWDKAYRESEKLLKGDALSDQEQIDVCFYMLMAQAKVSRREALKKLHELFPDGPAADILDENGLLDEYRQQIQKNIKAAAAWKVSSCRSGFDCTGGDERFLPLWRSLILETNGFDAAGLKDLDSSKALETRKLIHTFAANAPDEFIAAVKKRKEWNSYCAALDTLIASAKHRQASGILRNCSRCLRLIGIFIPIAWFVYALYFLFTGPVLQHVNWSGIHSVGSFIREIDPLGVYIAMLFLLLLSIFMEIVLEIPMSLDFSDPTILVIPIFFWPLLLEFTDSLPAFHIITLGLLPSKFAPFLMILPALIPVICTMLTAAFRRLAGPNNK